MKKKLVAIGIAAIAAASMLAAYPDNKQAELNAANARIAELEADMANMANAANALNDFCMPHVRRSMDSVKQSE